MSDGRETSGMEDKAVSTVDDLGVRIPHIKFFAAALLFFFLGLIYDCIYDKLFCFSRRMEAKDILAKELIGMRSLFINC